MQIKSTADTLLEVLSCLKAVGLANKPWETRTWSFILQQAKLQHIWSHMDHQHHSRQRKQMLAWYDQWWYPPYTEKHNSLPGRISLDIPCALNDLLYCYSLVSVTEKNANVNTRPPATSIWHSISLWMTLQRSLFLFGILLGTEKMLIISKLNSHIEYSPNYRMLCYCLTDKNRFQDLSEWISTCL